MITLSGLILILILMPLISVECAKTNDVETKAPDKTVDVFRPLVSNKAGHEAFVTERLNQDAGGDNPDLRIVFDAVLALESILTKGKQTLMTNGQGKQELAFQQFVKYLNPPGGERCFADISRVISAANKRLGWALEMIDAAGKPGTAILQQSVIHIIGDYEECVSLETGLSFEGRYCRNYIVLSRINNITLSVPVIFLFGFCMPSSCEGPELEYLFNAYILSNPDISGQAYGMKCDKRHLNFSTKAKFVVFILSMFVAIIAAGTFYDVFYKRWWEKKITETPDTTLDSHNQKNGECSNMSGNSKSEYDPIVDPEMQKKTMYTDNNTASKDQQLKPRIPQIANDILLSFSCYTNTSKLLNTNHPPGSLECLNGLRFITNTWVILFHTYVVAMHNVANMRPYLDDLYDRWLFEAVFNAFLSCDTFFLMGGVLVSYNALKHLSKSKEVTAKYFVNFYIHRFWRLTPVYMLILMTYVTLFKYLAEGPYWPQEGYEIDECEDTWWYNLLYINNFVKYEDMCMGWTWYMSVDMQLYIISPLLTLPLVFFDYRGLVVTFAFLLGNVISSGVISNVNDLQSSMNFISRKHNYKEDYFLIYYVRPYTRMGPYLIGVITGYLLWKCKDRKVYLSPPVVMLGWIVATGTAIAVAFGLHGHRIEDYLSTDVTAIYTALHRIAWGMCIAWIVFAGVHGYGGFVNTFLAWKFWVPLSRLSYCAYMVQSIVVNYYFYSQKRPFYLDSGSLLIVYLGITVLCYAVAYVTTIAFEIPMLGLEKAVKDYARRSKART